MTFTHLPLFALLSLVACHAAPPSVAADAGAPVAPGQGGNPLLLSFARSMTVHDPQHGLDVRCDFTAQAGAAVCDSTTPNGARHVVVPNWVAGNGEKKPGTALDLWSVLNALPPGVAADAPSAHTVPSNALRIEVDHPSNAYAFGQLDDAHWAMTQPDRSAKIFEAPGVAKSWASFLQSSGLTT